MHKQTGAFTDTTDRGYTDTTDRGVYRQYRQGGIQTLQAREYTDIFRIRHKGEGIYRPVWIFRIRHKGGGYTDTLGYYELDTRGWGYTDPFGYLELDTRGRGRYTACT